MILIIEGMDRCGKTTLIENLRKKYFVNPRILVHHSSSPPLVEDPNLWEINHYSSLLDTSYMLLSDGYDIIFDRFHLGAIVYGQKYRGAYPDNIYGIEKRLVHSNDKIALVLLTDDSISIAERDDNKSIEKSANEYSQVGELFDVAYNTSIIPNKLRINITQNGGFQNTYGSVTRFLRGVEGEPV